MTGGQLLQDLLLRPHLSRFGEFEQYCGQDPHLAFMLGQHKTNIEKFFCDGDMQPNEFWAFVPRNPWLLSLASSNGEVNKLTWSQLLQSFPEEKRLALSLELIPDTFLFSVEHSIWFFFAKGYANLEIEVAPPALETGVQEEVTRKKTKRTPVKASKSAVNDSDAELVKYRRAQMANRKPRKKSSAKRKYWHDDKSLDLYLREIGETPLISRAEEARLAKQIRAGNEAALHKLTKANLRFVVSVAKQYQHQGLELTDIINEGNIGLIKAAKRFDETRGFKFISYAVWWIRQAILQALAEQSRIVRLPLNRVGTLHKIGKASRQMEQNLERLPSSEELAIELGLTESEIEYTKEIATSHLSLDAPFTSSDGENNLLDLLEDEAVPSPDDRMLSNSLRLEVLKALDTLTPRQAEVINLYFGLGREKALTLEDIGGRFSLTRERVRQIKEKAIKRLRHVSRSRSLRAYLT